MLSGVLAKRVKFYVELGGRREIFLRQHQHVFFLWWLKISLFFLCFPKSWPSWTAWLWRTPRHRAWSRRATTRRSISSPWSGSSRRSSTALNKPTTTGRTRIRPETREKLPLFFPFFRSSKVHPLFLLLCAGQCGIHHMLISPPPPKTTSCYYSGKRWWFFLF